MSDGNGALPEGWAASTIEEVCRKVTDGTHFTPKFVEEGIPFITVRHVNNGAIDYDSADRIPREKYDELCGTYQPLKGDVLFSKDGTVGKVYLVEDPPEYIVLSSLAILRPEAELLDSRFLAHALKSPSVIAEATNRKSGTAIRRIILRNLRKVSVRVPPLAEQGRIVSKIESLQERSSRARVALSEVGPLLDQFRQSVLRAAFSGRLTADWRAAHRDVEPATELLNRIRTERRHRWEQSELAKYEAKGKKPPKNWKDKCKEPQPVDGAELPELPDGWCWVRFEQCAWEITVGHVGPMKHRYVDDGVTMLRSQNVRPLSFELENCEFIPPDFDQEIRKSRLTGNEILVVRSGVNVGDCCVYPESNGPANCSDLVITRPLPGLNPHFGAMYVESPTGKAALRLQRVGNAQPHFNVGSMKRSLFPLAPEAEQQQIVDSVYATMESIEALAQLAAESESSLVQLDQSILAKAFRGELVPQDPRDEPASELLARIRTTREATQPKKKTRKRKPKQEAEA